MYATSKDLGEPRLHSTEGTVQRVDYPRRKMTVIADGQSLALEVPDQCQLWFDGRLAPFRCFQPLDCVRAIYVNQDRKHIAQALYVWAAQSHSLGG